MTEKLAIVAGVRTPFCRAGGELKEVGADMLGAVVARESLYRSGLTADMIDEVIFGNVCQPSDALNIARVVGLRAGLSEFIPAYTVHRNCASGMEAFTTAMDKIVANRADVILVGGTESMSNVPLLFSKPMQAWFEEWFRAKKMSQKWGLLMKLKLKNLMPVIALKEGLTDPVCNQMMGKTAENLAEEFQITRHEQDEYALMSHQRALKAQAQHIFEDEIVPVPVGVQFDGIQQEDEGPRADQSMEKLGKMKPYFKRHIGTVTVGNSCGITDGAASAVLMKASRAKALGLKPLGYLVDYAYAGLQPQRMGLGPVFSTARLLKQSGYRLKDIDLIEMNEAFSAQILANVKAFSSQDFAQKELDQSQALGDIDLDKLNINGGAIALGHPVGASGSRIIITLLNSLRRQNKHRGIATLCVGGGQGGACLVEVES